MERVEFDLDSANARDAITALTVMKSLYNPCIGETFDIAIDACKKQVLMEQMEEGVCPICDTEIKQGQRYCGHCGQAIRW